MKTLLNILVASCLTLLLACCRNDKTPDKVTKTDKVLEVMSHTQMLDKPIDGMFIHLSSGPENPQRVLMAFNLAKKMSKDKDVLMYLDIAGVYTVLKDTKEITYNEFPPLSEILADLEQSSVKITVCPTCLKAAGKTPDDLLNWVTVASKDKFYDFTQGRIISIDY